MRRGAATHGDAGTTNCWLAVVAVTLSSAPIWRMVQPWPYTSVARLTSTGATVASLSLIGFLCLSITRIPAGYYVGRATSYLARLDAFGRRPLPAGSPTPFPSG